jgi:phosphoglycerate dehydrogenase-like enzyme
MSQVKQVVWSQWPDLKVPAGFTKLSPENFPLESSDLSEITIYVQPYMTGAELLEPVKAMTNLQLLQVPNAGYESAIPYIRDGVMLCNAKGVHNASTAELAVGMAIAMKRGFPEFIRLGDQGIWSHERMGSLNDSTIGIIGAGSIGQTLVSYLTPYEVDITTFSRSGSNGSLPMERLDELLPTFDILFLILPLNAESEKLINAKRLALMKDRAILVNVARGKIVDTDALVRELNTGRISAALDVTDPEPLPADHPLWRAKNVMITPHVGGDSEAFEKRGRRFIESQLQRIADGLPPLNIIDLKGL